MCAQDTNLSSLDARLQRYIKRAKDCISAWAESGSLNSLKEHSHYSLLKVILALIASDNLQAWAQAQAPRLRMTPTLVPTILPNENTAIIIRFLGGTFATVPVEIEPDQNGIFGQAPVLGRAPYTYVLGVDLESESVLGLALAKFIDTPVFQFRLPEMIVFTQDLTRIAVLAQQLQERGFFEWSLPFAAMIWDAASVLHEREKVEVEELAQMKADVVGHGEDIALLPTPRASEPSADELSKRWEVFSRIATMLAITPRVNETDKAENRSSDEKMPSLPDLASIIVEAELMDEAPEDPEQQLTILSNFLLS